MFGLSNPIYMKINTLMLVAGACVVLACNSEKKQLHGRDSMVTTPPATAATESPAAVKIFDINSIAISEKPLGAFPYFSPPENYQNFSKNEVADYDVAYFWVKDHFEKPEGKIFYNRITAKTGKSYSDLELARNLDEVIKNAGGIKVSEMKVPGDSSYTVPDNNKVKYMNGYGFMANAITTTYLIRRADKNIWIQLTPGDDAVSAGWMILETKPIK